jgi:hypothetical protein
MMDYSSSSLSGFIEDLRVIDIQSSSSTSKASAIASSFSSSISPLSLRLGLCGPMIGFAGIPSLTFGLVAATY